MRLTVAVRVDPVGGSRPAPGSPVTVELRDTGLADAPSVVLASGHGRVAHGDDPTIAEVELDVDTGTLPDSARLTVSAQVIAGETRAVGDWITMQSHPVDPRESDELATEVTLRRIG